MSARYLIGILLSCVALLAHAQEYGFSFGANCYPTKQAACNSIIGFSHPTLGTVDGIFENGLPRECSAHWSTDPPGVYATFHTGICLISPPPPPPPVPVTIDPGHGFRCPEAGMKVGAVGVTNFTTPPVGFLREDDLAMAVANEVASQMPSSYRVVLTKKDADACPSFLTRGRIANNSNSKLFVSIHFNAPGFLATGTLTLYNINKSGSFNLADSMARDVSSALGVNNRGARVDEEIAVLKPTVTSMNAVLLEAARLSGRDEEVLHDSTATGRIASGVVSSIRGFVGR